MSLLVKNGLIVSSKGIVKKDILCENGKIKKIDDSIDIKVDKVIDAKSLCVLPGIIDAHTHYGLVSRGTITADSFEEGSRCASYGGVTTIIDFADHHENQTIIDGAKQRIKEMSESMAIDFHLHQSICRYYEGLDKDLEKLNKMGIYTTKLYTTYKKAGFYIDDKDHDKVFSLCKKHNTMITVHCEDDKTIENIAKTYNSFKPKDHPFLRPSEAEALAIEYICGLALKYDMPIYIVHLSSEKGLKKVREARNKNTKVIVESTPHYLRLTSSLLQGDKGSLYVMTPPLREKEDNIALQEALKNEEIQVVATDHCSFTYEQKLESDDIRTLYPGIPGSQELLVNTWYLENKIGNNLTQVVKVLCENPSMEFGLDKQKGFIKEGYDCDLVLFDPNVKWTMQNNITYSASKYSPFADKKMLGKVVKTIKGGKVIVEDDKYYGVKGEGKFLKAVKPLCYR